MAGHNNIERYAGKEYLVKIKKFIDHVDIENERKRRLQALEVEDEDQ